MLRDVPEDAPLWVHNCVDYLGTRSVRADCTHERSAYSDAAAVLLDHYEDREVSA